MTLVNVIKVSLFNKSYGQVGLYFVFEVLKNISGTAGSRSMESRPIQPNTIAQILDSPIGFAFKSHLMSELF